MAHDRRTGTEPWAWLAAVPEGELDRDWQRVASSMAVSVQTASPPTAQRIGDLVIYCGATTGILAGVTEVVGEAQQDPDEPTRWRLRILPHLLLDRSHAPSIAHAGIEPPRTATRLHTDECLRLRELMLSAAVPLGVDTRSRSAEPTRSRAERDPGSPTADENGWGHDRRTGDEPWAWLVAVSDEELDRDWHRVTSSIAVTLRAATLPATQRVGDLVVYHGASTGVIAGVGEVVGEPHQQRDAPAQWRLRVLPRLLLDRSHAPSIVEAGMQPRRLPVRLDTDPYARLRELMLSAAVPLATEAGSGTKAPR